MELKWEEQRETQNGETKRERKHEVVIIYKTW